MNKNVELLLSTIHGSNLNSLSPQQKLNLADVIKKQSTYLLFNANRALQSKDYSTAKKILLYLADACSMFDNSDKQIQQILAICCEYLAVIQKKSKSKKTRRDTSMLRQSVKKKTNLVVLKYSKYSGLLKFEECDKHFAKNKDLVFYISKLNSILFSNQNIESQHSITVISKTYSWAFIFSFLLIILLFGTFFLNLLTGIDNQNNLTTFLPLICCGISFIIPLLMIYIKKPFQKDTHFFQVKLGEQIEKINSQCKRQGKKIQFLMPQGIELNIKIGQQQQPNEQIQKMTITDSVYLQHRIEK